MVQVIKSAEMQVNARAHAQQHQNAQGIRVQGVQGLCDMPATLCLLRQRAALDLNSACKSSQSPVPAAQGSVSAVIAWSSQSPRPAMLNVPGAQVYGLCHATCLPRDLMPDRGQPLGSYHAQVLPTPLLPSCGHLHNRALCPVQQHYTA